MFCNVENACYKSDLISTPLVNAEVPRAHSSSFVYLYEYSPPTLHDASACVCDNVEEKNLGDAISKKETSPAIFFK